MSKGIGRNINFNIGDFKINMFQPDPNKPGISTHLSTRFKARTSFNYNRWSVRTRNSIKRQIQALYGQNIVLLNVPMNMNVKDRIKSNNLSLEIVINYNGDNLKKDIVFIAEIKSLCEKIIDEELLKIVN